MALRDSESLTSISDQLTDTEKGESPSGEVILLTDNHDLTLYTLPGMLIKKTKRNGIKPTVYTAMDVETAIAMLRNPQVRYTGLIVDGMNGRCEEIIEVARSLHIPVKLLTASPEKYQPIADKWQVPLFVKERKLDFLALADFSAAGQSTLPQ